MSRIKGREILGPVYLPSRSKDVKIWGRWSGLLLVDCCGSAVILGGACVEICWERAQQN